MLPAKPSALALCGYSGLLEEDRQLNSEREREVKKNKKKALCNFAHLALLENSSKMLFHCTKRRLLVRPAKYSLVYTEMINHTSSFLNTRENVMWQHINPPPHAGLFICVLREIKIHFLNLNMNNGWNHRGFQGLCQYLSEFSKFRLIERVCFAFSWREINAEINSS